MNQNVAQPRTTRYLYLRRRAQSAFHCASGGILLWPQSHFDWVRPGIILYGVSPLEDRSTGAEFGCQPVMSLTSSLIAVREHKAPENLLVMVEPG